MCTLILYHELILTDTLSKVYNKAYKVAQAEKVDLLITGELGTGKEELARFIHRSSPTRSSKPFLKIDAGALSEDVFHYKLFGYKRGAFPGAIHDYKGLLVEAHGGTVYIENIDELSPRNQMLLKDFLENRYVTPLVGRDKKVDVRIIAGSKLSLKQLFEKKAINEDLLYFLELRLHLPAFRTLPVDEKKEIINKLLEARMKLIKRRVRLELCKMLWDFFIGYEFE